MWVTGLLGYAQHRTNMKHLVSAASVWGCRVGVDVLRLPLIPNPGVLIVQQSLKILEFGAYHILQLSVRLVSWHLRFVLDESFVVRQSSPKSVTCNWHSLGATEIWRL